MTPARLTKPTSAFHKVDRDASFPLDYHATSWWRSSGFMLAVMLDKAGYSDDAQYRLLKFIRAITPILGNSHASGTQHWKSFMTDDHTPIEVSWDWRVGDQRPKIRFSIEPVGPHAGTILDPDNRYAAPMLQGFMARALPNAQLEWLAHFQRELCGTHAMGSAEGHSSREFYAFDLEEKDIVSKAYFFPGFKAKATGQSNYDVITDTIASAPGSSPEKLQALEIFHDFIDDPDSPQLEMDMLAIDLVEPDDSRFKIYFRIRDGSFDSIRNAITLGGRLDQQSGMEQGIQRLRQFYYDSLGRGAESPADGTSLLDSDHRTAGILYNAEFKYGSTHPRVKVYLPVRHYVDSEEVVMHALDKHFRRTQSPKVATMSQYREAIYTSL